MVATFTPNYNWPKPDTEKDIDQEFYRLRDVTLDAIDAALKSVQTLAEGKANQSHEHPMSQIQGLIDALNGKMAANRTFTLDDLGDVQGAAIAATNYVLVKSSSGPWVASSALAALGQHGHTTAEITGLTAALAAKADAAAVNNVLLSLDQAVATRLRYLPTGAALPASNLGPLWHDDYASVMTWQVFNANGASFAGYASIEVGRPTLDGQPSARPGYLKRNGSSISKTTYAALWNWALHTGRVVTLGSWASGSYVFADNGNGTFRIPDTRGEFERVWDDGRGVDSGRAFGSFQPDAMQGHHHSINPPYYRNVAGGAQGMQGSAFTPNGNRTEGPISDGVNGTPRVAAETRSRSVALLGDIKF